MLSIEASFFLFNILSNAWSSSALYQPVLVYEALKDQMNQKMKQLIIQHCQTFKGLQLKDAKHNSETALQGKNTFFFRYYIFSLFSNECFCLLRQLVYNACYDSHWLYL